MDNYEFRNVYGHIEVYEKLSNIFVVSGDTIKEAMDEIKEILSCQN